jgi:hypothetical protein
MVAAQLYKVCTSTNLFILTQIIISSIGKGKKKEKFLFFFTFIAYHGYLRYSNQVNDNMPMQNTHLKVPLQSKHSGYALLLMLLIIVVICGLIWLDPSALFQKRRDSSGELLPWKEHFRLLKPGQECKEPSEEQAAIEHTLIFTTEAKQEDEPRGEIHLMIRANGRIEGSWGAEYNPRPQLNYLVMGANFKGNIDPSKIYSDEYGEDQSKLYFIAKGKFLILESRLESGRVRSVKGHIYVTGWLDPDYNATGRITITSDKRSFERFTWQVQAVQQKTIFDFIK